MKITIFKAILVISVIILAGLMLGSCISFSKKSSTATPTVTVTQTTTAVSPTTSTSASTWTAPPATASSVNQALPNIADVVAAVKPSVVAINIEVTSYDFFNRAYTQQGAGSGWIIDSNGIIVTNNHVIEGAKTVTVTLDNGRTYNADPKNIYTDSLNDLAIIKLDATGLPALKVGDASKMRVGDWVVAIGNSLGQGIRASEGIISEKNVTLQMDANNSLYDLIETSAAINPGNSGGPLVNMDGQVVGITSAKISSVGVEAMGYAISIDTALPILQELVNKGYVTRPYIGVGLYTVDQLAIAQLQLAVSKGAVVTSVSPGSPSDKAGLKYGDVIVSLGGKDVTDVASFTQIINDATIGAPLTLTYWRGNEKQTITITPVESPAPTG
jgi:serine protease Do